jgi:hypothetical protein
MKTKTFLLICLLAGMGMSRLSAQTKSVPYKFNSADLGFALELPVYCDGGEGEVDRVLVDEFIMEGVDHYVNGVKVWTTCRVMGTAHSKFPPYEVFTYKETDQKAIWSGSTYTAIYNLKGDLGHHYIGTLSVEFTDNIEIKHPDVLRTICTVKGPNKK